MAKLSDLPGLLAAQDWPRAEALLRREASKSGAAATVFYNLGKVLEAGDKYDQSGRWFEKAVGKQPNYAMAWFELGRWYLGRGMLNDSLEAFGNAVALDPSDSDAQRNFARLALRLGRWRKAREAWSSFDDNEARQARYRIAAETGKASAKELRALLDVKSERPRVLKVMTRTAKGRIPLKID